MKKSLGAAHAGFSDGSVTLSAGWSPRYESFSHTLTFRPNHEQRVILCSSSVEGDEKEPFVLDALNAAVVESKVKPFAYAIARGTAPEPRSLYTSLPI